MTNRLKTKASMTVAGDLPAKSCEDFSLKPIFAKIFRFGGSPEEPKPFLMKRRVE